MSDRVPGTGASSAGGEGQDDRGDAQGSNEGASTSDAGRRADDSAHIEAEEQGSEGRPHGAYAQETPEQLLGEVAAVRRRTRQARHPYWFPLVLFGLLTCASIPFYIQHIRIRFGGIIPIGVTGPRFLQSGYLGGFSALSGRCTSYYWLAAILVGVAATAAWYRWRGNRVGLRMPARGYLITGAALLVLALGIPAVAVRAAPRLMILMPGDLLIRGTFPLVIIGIGLCYLAWAERSAALTVIAVGYLALSLIASLYDIENVFYKLGWNLSPEANGLPNVVLPALVLLLSGAGAWVVQRRRRLPRVPTAAGPASQAS